MREKYYYCQFQIETDGEACGNQCSHCKNYYYPLEQERKIEDLKEWIESKESVGTNPQTFNIILDKEWKKRNIL